jgi:predicted ATPase
LVNLYSTLYEMSRIKIKNFGPIKDGCQENDGWIDIRKVTVFIGNQGSGKSTVAKLISTFTWIEKALVRGDYDEKWFVRKNKLKNQFLTYHRLENYLTKATEIEYKGLAYNISYRNESLVVEEIHEKEYPLPQIMYVPAERNFIAYVKSPKELKLSSDSLNEFLTEYDYAKDEIKGVIKLPINKTDVEYDRLNNVLNIKGDDYKIRLTEASSGFQSLVPLYLVSRYLANSVKKQSENKDQMSNDERSRFRKTAADIYSNPNLTDEQKRLTISALSSRFNKIAFVNVVEEPEQNLFPESQWQMLESLLTFNNMNSGNKLVITSHSPYIINYLGIVIQGNYLKNLILRSDQDHLLSKLNEIVSLESITSSDEIAIYQLDENIGSIKKLPDFEGIPSDRNYLNQTLKDGNIMFDKLLEIEEEL